MKYWEHYKEQVAKCKSSDEVTECIRATEALALEYCSRHLPDLTECYKDNNPESKRATIYGLEYFMRSEVEQKK